LCGNKEPLTTDKDILKRHWLLIDVDPVRAAGISSTDAEKQHAFSVMNDVAVEFHERNFPPGIMSDSGNGWHLCVPCELPVADNGTVERLLKGLDKRYSTQKAKIDISVFNPARIWKLPGTMSCKGDNCPQLGRPWRMSRIYSIGQEVPNNA
jgi:hypothetical protein